MEDTKQYTEDEQARTSGFSWLDEDFAENDPDDIPEEIPKPQSAEEVLSEIEAGRFAVGIMVNVNDESISEKTYTEVQADFQKQNTYFQVEFHGSDADLSSIWQQLESYGNALGKYTGKEDSKTMVTCSLIFIPSKYASTVVFEVDMPVFWAIAASRIGDPADAIRLAAPTELIGVYETDFDAESEIQNIAINQANEAAQEEAEKRQQNKEAYREIYYQQD